MIDSCFPCSNAYISLNAYVRIKDMEIINVGSFLELTLNAKKQAT